MNNYKKDLNTNNVNNITNNVTNNARNNAIPNIGGGTFTYTKTITSGNGNPFINGNMNIPNVNVPVNNSNSTNCNNKEFRIINKETYLDLKNQSTSNARKYTIISSIIIGVLSISDFFLVKSIMETSNPSTFEIIEGIIMSIVSSLGIDLIPGLALNDSIINAKGYINSVKVLKKAYNDAKDDNNIQIPKEIFPSKSTLFHDVFTSS